MPRVVYWDRRLARLAIALFLILVVAFLARGCQAAREAGNQASCIGQFKVMTIGVLNYEAQKGRFPPAYLADKQGRPAHSWRVLLLPYVGAQDVLDRYRLEEPWNSPHNRSLAQGAPSGMTFFYPLYHCPSDRQSSKWDTSYLMIVGPRTISAGPTSTRMKDITDGASNTILVAEMCESGIHWMEPRDLRVDEMSFKINDPDYIGIASRHPGRAYVGVADGSVRSLPDNADPRLVEGATTINGREDVSALWKDY